MSPDEPTVDEPRQRPTTVSVAGYCLYAIVIVAVISAIVSIVFVDIPLGSAIRHALSDPKLVPSDQRRVAIVFTMIALVGQVVVSLICPVAVGIMAPLNLKGRNGARITTWVFAGLGLLCSVCGLVALPMNLSPNSAGYNADKQSDALNRALTHAAESVHIPGWVTAVGVVEVIALFVLYLLAIIFLAVPASNDYFRKRPPKIAIIAPVDGPKPPKA
ncbi:MAG TPA: hypothetical protein VE172_04325 [Stackebrandtia sp.]|jgi:uncharacterized membrane protein|uniref:hypothetical protein n=1 Tax=Stackebrandtia sp. TaxID=2023065 RepID=UPI002D48ADAB|nr:hypothetical protein [Stackebrandtia sp.]HZE38018.1 hypothetical protein [Stackebrandtia sp.]